MEGDPAAGGVFRVGAFGGSIDDGARTGGANQRLLVPVCRDQDERLRRSIFLDASTSHGLPFRWGLMARNWRTHPSANLGKNSVPRKADTVHMRRADANYRCESVPVPDDRRGLVG